MTGGRTCIIDLAGLGDVVMGLAVANALKQDDPSRRIAWVVEPMPSAILRHHPAVDEVILYHKGRGIRCALELWRSFRRRRFDVALNLQFYIKTILPTLLARAPVRVGFARPLARDGVWLFLNRRVKPRSGQHIQDVFLQLLEPLGVRRPDPPEWRITFTEDEREAQRAFFARLDGRPVVTIVPASGRAPKDWPAERWARVAAALALDYGFRVVLTGGPGERETAIARAIVAAAAPAPLWALGEEVRKMAWIIAGSRLVLAPDTGPVHIARALDVPVIGLYGDTNPWRWGPYRKFEDLWIDAHTEPDPPPGPDARAGNTGGMERITVAEVLERVERAIARYPRVRNDAA